MAFCLTGTAAFTPVTLQPPLNNHVPTSTSTCTRTSEASASSTALFKKRTTASKKNKGGSTSKGFAGALRDLRADSFPYAGSIRPGTQSPQKIVVDESIMKPDYAIDGQVSSML